jgi:hypothetical protein
MSPKEFVWYMYVPVMYQTYLFPRHTSTLFWNICLNFTRTSCVLHLTAAITRCSVLMKAAFTWDTIFNTIAAWWWYNTYSMIWYGGPWYVSWCSDSLQAVWLRGWNPGGGKIFCTHPDQPWGPHNSYTLGTGSFPGVKRQVCNVYHLPPSRAEVTEIVELYLYPPLPLGLCGLF